MFCTICAHPLDTRHEICRHCGANWFPVASEDVGSSHQSARRWVVAALPLLALVIVGLAFVGRGYDQRRHQTQAYQRAAEALATGDLLSARSEFAAAGDYADAEQQVVALDNTLAPILKARSDAGSQIDAGNDQAAIDLLIPVNQAIPHDPETLVLIDEARTGLIAGLKRTAADAERSGDWLAADHAISTLLILAPDDQELSGQLAEIRRDHSPIIFSSRGSLFIADTELDEQRTLVDGMNVTWAMWSPDRRQIAFVTNPSRRRGISGNLYVVNAEICAAKILPFADNLETFRGIVRVAANAKSGPISLNPVDRQKFG